MTDIQPPQKVERDFEINAILAKKISPWLYCLVIMIGVVGFLSLMTTMFFFFYSNRAYNFPWTVIFLTAPAWILISRILCAILKPFFRWKIARYLQKFTPQYAEATELKRTMMSLVTGGGSPTQVSRYVWFVLWPSAISFTVFVVYTLNMVLDNSPEAIRNPIITEKHCSTRKGGRVACFVKLPPLASGDTDQRVFSDTGFSRNIKFHINVSKEEYDLIQPNFTRAHIVTRRGFFGIPWVARSKVEIDKAAL